jgi:ribose transport system permease protein
MSTMETAKGPAQAPVEAKRRRPVPLGFSRIGGVYIGVILVAIYAFWIPDTFFTHATLVDILGSQALTAILTIGLLLPLAAGLYDLSVGSMVGFSAILMAQWASGGMSIELAFVLVLLVGLAVGAINSFFVVIVGINSFIATLAMSSLLIAANTAVSNNELIVGIPHSLTKWGTSNVLGLPITVWYLVAFAIVMWWIVEHTPFGRYLFAIGSSKEAAKLAGVRTNTKLFVTLIVSAVVAAAVGAILTAKLNAGSPEVGQSYLLPAYAAAFLGATQVKMNRFNVIGTLIAVYVLAIGVKGLQLGGAASWVSELFNGVALLLAVTLARFQGKRMNVGWRRRLRRGQSAAAADAPKDL